ncbi:hypothetical protein SAMN05660477_01711 [Soonwooa buanensis]|uniref:Lipocalin-like domain-containing protein n=1 Tax=Soonwooa buanensis TaxID=619805 RepID=A0A1T5F1P2_9FLAO|nr:hypothetical protein [Soonwooa buanensis]SKB90102.1 hypothetical protein SAMN05660477_01711 [Soonwooa buanensis]
MKTQIKLFMLLFGILSTNFVKAQKVVVKKIQNLPKSSNIKINNNLVTMQVIGSWEITNVDGHIYVKPEKSNMEIEAPLSFWIGKVFKFQNNGKVDVVNGNSVMISSDYTIVDNGKAFSIPKYCGQFSMPFLVTNSGQNMTMTQSPESFYAILASQTKIPLDKVKSIYRVPSDIVFHLVKK